MKTLSKKLVTSFLCALMTLCLHAQTAAPKSPKEIQKMNENFEKMGWKVGIQSHTFTRFTLFETIDAAAELGLKYVEATTWQKIEPNQKESFNPWWMSAELKQKIKDKCAEKGVKIVSFYCRPSKEDIENESAQIEKIFQFCKEMDAILTTDPIRVESGFGSMEFYDNLCQKYGVTMVLTNHPKSHGSPYWNPDDILTDLEGRSKYIGASVDVGHFMRDGTDPYEAVKKYTDAGRMYHFHLRDVEAFGAGAKDVAIGDGQGRIGDMLTNMYAKGATPILVFEFERDQNEPLKYVIPSVEYLKTTSAKLLKEGQKKVTKRIAQTEPQGRFVRLLARDAAKSGNMRIEDKGLEKAIPRNEFLCTDREYGDFELRLKYKMKFPEGTNSWNAGIQIRSQSHPTIPHEMVGYQADILAGKWGALYDEQRRWMFLGTPLNEQEVKQVSKADDWNTYVIRCEGPRVRIWINGVKTLDFLTSTMRHPKKFSQKFLLNSGSILLCFAVRSIVFVRVSPLSGSLILMVVTVLAIFSTLSTLKLIPLSFNIRSNSLYTL